jgi:hypothetical protein
LAFTHTSQSHATRSSGKRSLLRSLAVTGGLAAIALAGTPASSDTAHAAPAVRQGLYLQHGWLCRSWSSGATHCTHHWHRSRFGALISDNQRWVPTSGGFTALRMSTPTHAAQRTFASAGRSVTGLAPEPCGTRVPYWVWTAVNYRRPWTVPPGCYGGVFYVNTANYVHRSGFGWCNWWPEVLRPDVANLLGGRRYGAPRVGAAVVFAPFNQGASAGGHYGHVEAIAPDGQYILISEMNDTWRGAGFGRVNYRYVRVEPGVSFIY